MKILGVIPARFASTRFPGKPLVMIEGKSMIQRVYEQAKKCESLAHIVVATDDARIFDHVLAFGGAAMMTDPKHESGTDRCAEVVEKLNFEIQTAHLDSDEAVIFDKIKRKRAGIFTAVINIQGDEPFIDPEQIEKIADILRGARTDYEANQAASFDIATLAKELGNQQDIDNPNVVKVVFGENGRAVYFSRSPIPYLRDIEKELWADSGQFFRHIGLYGYKTSVLQAISKLPKSLLEEIESLEQLRWLENGYSIGVAETELETIGIDTPEDLKKL